MTSQQFEHRLHGIATRMEDVLEQALPEPAGAQSKVMEAMRYAVLGGASGCGLSCWLKRGASLVRTMKGRGKWRHQLNACIPIR